MVISIVIIQAFSSKKLDKNYDNKINTDKTFEEINISEYRIKTIFDKKIKNRITKIFDHKVFIGETDKQIGNGYYE